MHQSDPGLGTQHNPSEKSPEYGAISETVFLYFFPK